LRKKSVSPVPTPFQNSVVNLINQAQIQSLLDFWIDERANLGLPEKPVSAYSSERAVQQAQEIVKETRFDRTVRFDWKKRGLRK
jgi:heterodisulfide reductase subunit C